MKERVWRFIEALLTCAEDSPNFDVGWETDKNTGRPNLVVKTKRRFLENLAQLKKQELTDVIKSLENLQIWDDRRLRRGKGSEIGSFALKLWSTDAQRNREQFEQVWKGSRTEKSKALEATYNKSKDSAEASQSEIDWRDVCRTMLEKQKQLTTNRLMRADEMLFDIDRIRVDLALVERKQTDKRNEDDNPARSHLYKPDYEETQKLEYEEFLTKVLKSEQSKKLAIIGEPGAGKTTLLQRIAFWILENTDDLPIWIPLGNFPNPAPKFKDYLLNDWLEDAIPSVTPKIKAEFEERLMAGKVWLLLDGVDEMAAKSGSPLTVIANRIVGWCDRLRVVLTCRLNVWEANPYFLNGFQTYRTLEFSEEKVEEFINACFQKSDPKLGIQLQQALNQPGKERIKDLVRNPLRLTLLCSTWHLQEGKLPDTKAELYQQFVEEVYRWQDKEKEVSTITSEEREQLNAKLKKLAVAAIDKETNRFCLRHKFVEGVFGDSALFQLALNVGWLNQVGVDAKNPNQRVYAFFHPTFEEYFAALAIDDWDFFLPRAHDNHNPKPVSERYRIFEPQWKEVILLWLGREEVEREQFIQALVEFKDGCREWLFGYEGFYEYRAYFLAAAAIAEFRECSLANQIVKQVVKWSFGENFNSQRQQTQLRRTFAPRQMEERAKATLLERHHPLAVNALIEVMHTTFDEYTRIEVAEIVGKIDPGNSLAIATLIEIMHNGEQGWRTKAVRSLGKIAKANQEAITALVNLIHTIGTNSDERLIRVEAASSLSQIDPEHPDAIPVVEYSGLYSTFFQDAVRSGHINPNDPEYIAYLVEKIQSNPKDEREKFDRLWAVQHLKASDINEPKASAALINLIRTNPDEETLQEAVRSLGRIGKSDPEAIDLLIELSCKSQNLGIRWQAIQSLCYTDTNHEKAIWLLIELIGINPNEQTGLEAAESLGQVLQRYPLRLAVSALKNILPTQINDIAKDLSLSQKCYNPLLHCAQTMPYPAFYQAWHQQERLEKTTTPDSQSLNQADLPQNLQSAIANDPQLSQTIHLICIDGNQFIEPDRPAAEIYDQMLDQNCPECNPVPDTMPALKLYWNSLRRNSDKQPVLVFYASSTEPYSEAFFTVLSKFGREICVITEQRFDHIPLKFFAPSQTIEDVVKWIQTMVVEE